ncbi:MAG TPA: hypothetical protein VF195_06260, partial [Actinomycetota bacterium]
MKGTRSLETDAGASAGQSGAREGINRRPSGVPAGRRAPADRRSGDPGAVRARLNPTEPAVAVKGGTI